MTDFSMTMSERIAENIIDLIATNEIKLCSRLVERDLMERFGVSQTVIREARLLLESKGLVTTKPHKGTYVNNPSSAEISMLFEVRKILDIFAVRNAVLHHTENDILELRKLNAEAEKAYKQGDYLQFFRISRKFHIYIYECSGFSCLTRVYDDLITLTDIFHYNAHVSKKINLTDDVKGHARICDAIESGDTDLCVSIISQHIDVMCSHDLGIIGAPDS